MTMNASDESQSSTPESGRVGRDVAKLLVRTAALAFVTLLTVVAIAWFVPESNTYASASAVKHSRLEKLESPKIVVVGGSNLAFGLDSPMIEEATGRRVVNMGMDGFLGLRFMLAEVEPSLQRSDLVVIALEYGAYYKDIDGVAENQFAVIKANPTAAAYVTWEQKRSMLLALPRIARLKLARFVLVPARALRSLIKGSDYQSAGQVEEAIGSVDGFNEHGDLLAHLDVEQPGKPFDGDNLREAPINLEALDMIEGFAKRAQERGVSVMISYTPIADTYYERYRDELAVLHEAITTRPGLQAPAPPSAFVYREALFFDTVYHLRREGREARTKKLIEGIKTKIPAGSG